MTLLPLLRYHSASLRQAARCNARARTRSHVVCGLTLALFGCAAATVRPPPEDARGQAATSATAALPPAVGSPAPLRVATTIVTPDSAVDVEELFVSGQTKLRQGQYA